MILKALIVLVKELFSSLMCLSNFSLSSRYIPRYLTAATLFIVAFSILMLFRMLGTLPLFWKIEY